MAVTFVGSGVLASRTSGNITPGIPSGVSAGDLLRLTAWVKTASGGFSGPGSFATPSGWTVLNSSSSTSGYLVSEFYKTATGSDSAPNVLYTDPAGGSYQNRAVVEAYRGVDLTAGPTSSTFSSNTSSASIPLATISTLAGGLVLSSATFNDAITSGVTTSTPNNLQQIDGTGSSPAVISSYGLPTSAGSTSGSAYSVAANTQRASVVSSWATPALPARTLNLTTTAVADNLSATMRATSRVSVTTTASADTLIATLSATPPAPSRTMNSTTTPSADTLSSALVSLISLNVTTAPSADTLSSQILGGRTLSLTKATAPDTLIAYLSDLDARAVMLTSTARSDTLTAQIIGALPLSARRYTALVTSEHTDKTKFISTVSLSVSASVDEQNLLTRIYRSFDVDEAFGMQLGFVSEWVGASRFVGSFTLNDDEFRTLIRARIARNYWDGTTPSAYTVLSTYFTGNAPLIFDRQNMTMEIGLAGAVLTPVQLAVYNSDILSVRPAGVMITAKFYPTTPGPLFGLNMETASVKGLNEGAIAGHLP